MFNACVFFILSSFYFILMLMLCVCIFLTCSSVLEEKYLQEEKDLKSRKILCRIFLFFFEKLKSLIFVQNKGELKFKFSVRFFLFSIFLRYIVSSALPFFIDRFCNFLISVYGYHAILLHYICVTKECCFLLIFYSVHLYRALYSISLT